MPPRYQVRSVPYPGDCTSLATAGCGHPALRWVRSVYCLARGTRWATDSRPYDRFAGVSVGTDAHIGPYEGEAFEARYGKHSTHQIPSRA